MRKGRKVIDLVGKRYGQLAVVSRGDTVGQGHYPRWLCRCDCGSERLVRGVNLKSGATRSCGCLTKTVGNRNKSVTTLPGNLAIKRLIYRNYQGGASAREIQFLLTEEQAFSIFSRPCEYCGIEWSMEKRRGTSLFRYNGIDRVDSSQGYDIQNCVPCCTKCNLAKRGMAVDEFIQWVTRVYTHSGR